MKILQINGYESPGKRFNGLSITPLLKEYGVESKHFVWCKDTNNPHVITLPSRINRATNLVKRGIERILSLQSMLYTNAKQIIALDEFKEADLIHLHIIHSCYFSIKDLELITNLKPTVWTLHDPWALTGHCIHPLDCTRWKDGCGNCPDLKSYQPLFVDNTKLLFEYKKRAYKKAQFDLIVASQWMKDLVEASPIFDNGINVHKVSFGLDLNLFSPRSSDEIKRLKKKIGVEEGNIVLCFRADKKTHKGLNYIKEALNEIKVNQKITLLTVGSQGLLNSFKSRFQVIENNWVNDEKIMSEIFTVSDIFLMPSVAESFGMMAVEAMACGTPVICFNGGALGEVVASPDIGIALPTGDVIALTKALQRLIETPQERLSRGKKGRVFVETHYNIDQHIESIVSIYKQVISTRAENDQ